MRKKLVVLLIFVLCFVMAACGAGQGADDPQTEGTQIKVAISITDGEGDDIVPENFTPVEKTEFAVNENATVLEATQAFCEANHIEISLDSSKSYVTALNGLAQMDYADTTGWVFKVNGEMGSLGATEAVLADGDEIGWEFVDFTAMEW